MNTVHEPPPVNDDAAPPAPPGSVEHLPRRRQVRQAVPPQRPDAIGDPAVSVLLEVVEERLTDPQPEADRPGQRGVAVRPSYVIARSHVTTPNVVIGVQPTIALRSSQPRRS